MKDRQNIIINKWASNTEILRVKPDGEFVLGNGIDPLVALGELSKAFIRQQNHIQRLEEAYSASEALHTVKDCACCDSPDVWIRCSTCCDKIKRYHTANFNLNRTEATKETNT